MPVFNWLCAPAPQGVAQLLSQLPSLGTVLVALSPLARAKQLLGLQEAVSPRRHWGHHL